MAEGSYEIRPTDKPDWAAQVTDKIVGRIDSVRDKTTRRAVFATRVLVYGVALAILGLVAAVLAVITLIRLSALLSRELSSQMYWAYLVWGLVFTAIGVYLLRKAARVPDSDR